MKNKSLNNKVIIFDDSCPMCKVYTGAFVKWGLISKNNRLPFSKAINVLTTQFNLKRARHHIPLVDANTGQTLYGIESLCYILAMAIPSLSGLLNKKWFQSLFAPLYNLISYNRRVIAGTKPPTSGFDCAPDFNLKWRLGYISLACIVVISISTILSTHLSPLLGIAPINVLAAIGLGWVLTGLTFIEQSIEKTIAFFGHLATIALIGATLMLPSILFTQLPSIIVVALVSFCIMLQQMIKRIDAQNVSPWMIPLWFFLLLGGALFTFQLVM